MGRFEVEVDVGRDGTVALLDGQRIGRVRPQENGRWACVTNGRTSSSNYGTRRAAVEALIRKHIRREGCPCTRCRNEATS